jgi:hypothetical protein
MAEIIDLKDRRREKDNLIIAQPLEFRRGDWLTGYAMLCTRQESARYEAHRREAFQHPGHQHIGFVPNHFTLSEGYHYTVQGLFQHRQDEALMRRVYRLAGLMECITNASSPVLRTDILRRFYQSIVEERKALKVFWRGTVPKFLLPLHPEWYNPNLFFHRATNALTLKELYEVIGEETNTQFDILSRSYVFYLPHTFYSSGPDVSPQGDE